MKKKTLIGAIMLTFFAYTAFGQDIPQSQVPSLVVNSFQQEFPKVFEVEWKLDGGIYKVEFETGLLGQDHNVWYDRSGKLIRHKEEISKDEIPQKVIATINSDFNGYRVDDIKRITEDAKATYTLELKKLTEEWKVIFDSEGNLLSKVAD